MGKEQSVDSTIQCKMSSLLGKNEEPKLYVRVLHINFLAAPSTNQNK
jgi:hypothetical protein